MSARDWREHAKSVTPGGAQTRSKRDLYPDPVAIVGGLGSRVWSDTNTSYRDWISGLCAVGLGHQHPAVDEAVRKQLKLGTCMPLPTKLEVVVAEELMQTVKYGEMVRWVSTGSEATLGAMMIARKATGRRQIVSIGYHGWTSGHQKSYGVYEVPWGNLAKLEATLRNCYIAGVLLEPMRDHEPPEGYLVSVQALCRKYGCALIIDEIVTGFRWRVGGATEMFNLDPDICCYGKALSNGFRLGAIVGKRAVMQYADGVSSTFGGECVGLAAARATMRVYREEKVVERLWDVGVRLKMACADAGHPMSGYPVHPRFVSEEATGDEWYITPQDVRDLTHKLAAAGILAHPAGFNPMYAHTLQDAEDVGEALRG